MRRGTTPVGRPAQGEVRRQHDRRQLPSYLVLYVSGGGCNLRSTRGRGSVGGFRWSGSIVGAESQGVVPV